MNFTLDRLSVLCVYFVSAIAMLMIQSACDRALE